MTPRSTLNPHAALIYVMVVASAADAARSDAELHVIGDIVRTLPVFEGFDEDNIIPVSRECAAILQEDDGFTAVLGLVRDALPRALRETAYALALEIVLTEAPVYAEENRVLQRLKSVLEVDRLTAAALEKAAMVRHARITN